MPSSSVTSYLYVARDRTSGFALVHTCSTTAGIARDTLHHEMVNTRNNSSIGETFDSMHVKGASRAHPPATVVDFAHTDIDLFSVSEEENRVIKIPSKH